MRFVAFLQQPLRTSHARQSRDTSHVMASVHTEPEVLFRRHDSILSVPASRAFGQI